MKPIAHLTEFLDVLTEAMEPQQHYMLARTEPDEDGTVNFVMMKAYEQGEIVGKFAYNRNEYFAVRMEETDE